MFDEIFHLKISEGAIRNIFKKTQPVLEKKIAEIEEKSSAAPLSCRTRPPPGWMGQQILAMGFYWQGSRAPCHQANQKQSVPQDIFGDHHPDFWVSDMYGGQMGLGKTHQVCLAHQLRNLQYAIEAGDLIFAPRIKRLLVQAIRIGQKRDRFDDATWQGFRLPCKNGWPKSCSLNRRQKTGKDYTGDTRKFLIACLSSSPSVTCPQPITGRNRPCASASSFARCSMGFARNGERISSPIYGLS